MDTNLFDLRLPLWAQSYVRNCTIIARPGEVGFSQTIGGAILAHLDGYAIIPNEEFNRLKALETEVTNNVSSN